MWAQQHSPQQEGGSNGNDDDDDESAVQALRQSMQWQEREDHSNEREWPAWLGQKRRWDLSQDEEDSMDEQRARNVSLFYYQVSNMTLTWIS